MSRTKKAIAERFGLMSLLLATSALSSVTPAAAQESGSTGVGEIIVTATKRAENLQDVPMSITAFGTETLEQLHITDFNDYALMLPSVSFTSVGPGFGRVFFRGVNSGDNGNHSASLPSVGTYLDEQPITTITGNLDLHLYDINRVEALSGPQGTLYGASSLAGTVRIITNAPDPEAFSASYNVEVNSIDGGGVGDVVEGHVNIPISERAAIRIVGWQERNGGYIDNVPGSITFPTSGITMDNASQVEEDYNDVDTIGARAALRIDLNDNWTVTPTIMGQQQDSNGIPAFDPRVGDLQVQHFFPEFAEDNWVQAALTVEGRIGNLDVVYAGAHLTRDVDGAADYTDYAYFYDALAGYGAYFTDDLGNPINPAQYIQFYDRYRKQSHELRISSPAENRLRFVGGLFYQRQEHDIHQRYLVNGDLAAAYESNGLEDTIWLTEQTRTDIDYAVFGEVAYDLTDRLTGTVGARAFKAENSLFGFFGFSTGFSSNPDYVCNNPAPFRDAICTNLDKTVEEDGATYRVNLTYDVTDDVMIYGTYSTGFRPGGINRRGTLPPYDSDFLVNYEFGWKTLLMDGRLRFNGAAFFEQWEDAQFSVLGANGLTEVRNLGNAEITGIEADVSWMPMEHLEINAAATALHGETTSDTCNVDPLTQQPDCVNRLAAPSGTRLPGSAEFKANLTGRYTFMLGGLDSFAQLAVVYQGDVENDLRVTTGEAQLLGRNPAFTTVDFSAGVDMPSWSLSFYINNLTDERAEIYHYSECAALTCASDDAPGGLDGAVYVLPVQPRTFGIRFGQRF